MIPEDSIAVKPAILIVTHNGWSMTRDCLNGIYPLVKEFPIVVVDNASTDRTVEGLRAEFPEVTCVTLAENIGFGRANNVAAQQVPLADPLILINNDTLPNESIIRTLVEAYKAAQNSSSQPCIIAPSLKNVDGSMQANAYADVSMFTFFLNAFRTEASAAKYLQPKPVRVAGSPWYATQWASAVCWLVPRGVWDNLRGFDEAIFMYNEDYDFAWRARKLGAKYLIHSGIELIHLGGGSVVSTYSRAAQHDLSLEYVLAKRMGFFGVIFSKSFRLTRSLSRIVIACLQLPLKPQRLPYIVLHCKLLRLVLQSSKIRR